MRSLPLYEHLPRAPVEASERLKRDPSCARCELSKGVKTVCVPAAGKPGGVLVVGEGPGEMEDLEGRPFVGRSGSYLREQVARWWSGPVAVANATGCAPIKNAVRGPIDVEAKHVDACRPYLADTLARAKPTRIICVGSHAARAITGRAVPPTKTRRGYAYLFWTRLADAFREHEEAAGQDSAIDEARAWAERADAAERGECARTDFDIASKHAVPVFFLLHPAAALRNPFMRAAFEEDLEWALTGALPPKPPIDAFFELVETEEDDEDAARMLVAGRSFFDIEAGGEQWAPSYRVVSLAASVPAQLNDPASAIVWSTEALNDPARSGYMRAWLREARAEKGGSNVQYDINGLFQIAVLPRGVRRDVRLTRKLLAPDASGYLDDMADLVGMGGYKKGAAEDAANALAERIRSGLMEEKLRAKHAELVAQGKYKKPPKRPPQKGEHLEAWLVFKAADPEMAAHVERDPSWGARWSWVYAAMARYAPETLYRYNAFDAIVSARLDAVLDAELARVPRLLDTWVPIVSAMPEVVAQIEAWGMRANEAAVRAFDAYLVSKLDPIERRLAAYTSVTNWNSTQQVAKLLYGELGLKAPKKTDGGADSTDASALKALKGAHPIIDDLIEHSRYTDLRKTFACGSDGRSGMLSFIKPDGRMHPHILMDGTATGRSSCSDPNLYNIPAKKYPVEGKMARDIFVATPGSVIVSVDWSQIQLRLAAHLSGDEVMREIFTSGVDFHKRTAELIAPLVWKIRPEEVTDEHRAHAKNFNFGLLFGMGDHALACRMYNTQDPDRDQVAMAGKIRAAVLGAFKKLAAWIEREVVIARKTGMVVSQLDGRPARHRYVWDIADRDKGRRGHAEREVVNSPIQAEEAGMMHRSTIAVVRWIWACGLEDTVKVLLPLYDQLLMEVAREHVDDVVDIVPEIMTSWPCSVPLVADVELGLGWGSLRKMKRGQGGWACHVRDEKHESGKRAIWTPFLGGPLAAFDEAQRISG